MHPKKTMNDHTTKSTASLPALGIPSNKRAGSTLIEALVAMSIFAVFIAGTSQLLVSYRSILDLARSHYTAANIAKNRMELVRTFDFDQIPQLTETGITVNDSGIPSVLGHFRRSTTISTLNTNLYELAITVQVQDRKTLAFDDSGETLSTFISLHL